MARRLVLFLFVISMFVAVPQAKAQFGWISSGIHSMATDFKRNNCWPEPFIAADRYDVRMPFNVMVHNGWRQQNMIGEHHFDDMTGELTEAGKLKVHWILTQAPKQHRTVYVQKDRSQAITAQRLQAVQAISAVYSADGMIAQIELTDEPFAGWPADRVNFVNQSFETSAPPPRLPAATASGSSSGSSSGSGM
jgi:hypothetical protein